MNQVPLRRDVVLGSDGKYALVGVSVEGTPVNFRDAPGGGQVIGARTQATSRGPGQVLVFNEEAGDSVLYGYSGSSNVAQWIARSQKEDVSIDGGPVQRRIRITDIAEGKTAVVPTRGKDIPVEVNDTYTQDPAGWTTVTCWPDGYKKRYGSTGELLNLHNQNNRGVLAFGAELLKDPGILFVPFDYTRYTGINQDFIDGFKAAQEAALNVPGIAAGGPVGGAIIATVTEAYRNLGVAVGPDGEISQEELLNAGKAGILAGAISFGTDAAGNLIPIPALKGAGPDPKPSGAIEVSPPASTASKVADKVPGPSKVGDEAVGTNPSASTDGTGGGGEKPPSTGPNLGGLPDPFIPRSIPGTKLMVIGDTLVPNLSAGDVRKLETRVNEILAAGNLTDQDAAWRQALTEANVKWMGVPQGAKTDVRTRPLGVEGDNKSKNRSLPAGAFDWAMGQVVDSVSVLEKQLGRPLTYEEFTEIFEKGVNNYYAAREVNPAVGRVSGVGTPRTEESLTVVEAFGVRSELEYLKKTTGFGTSSGSMDNIIELEGGIRVVGTRITYNDYTLDVELEHPTEGMELLEAEVKRIYNQIKDPNQVWTKQQHNELVARYTYIKYQLMNKERGSGSIGIAEQAALGGPNSGNWDTAAMMLPWPEYRRRFLEAIPPAWQFWR